MHRHLRRWLLGLLLALLLSAGASAASVDAVYINCTVAEDGAASYSMAVTCRFESLEKSFTIPLAGEKVSGVSVSGASWALETQDGWNRVVLRSSDGFIGRQTLVVNWRSPAPSGEGYALPLISSRWEADIAELTFDVQLPAPLESAPVMTSGYSGELNGAATLTDLGFSGSLPDGLMAHEALSAALTLPDGYFSRPQLRTLLSLDWGLVFMALLAVLCVVYWLLTLRSRRPVIQSRVLPPEGWSPAEVPTVLWGQRPDMAAQLLQWAQLGYLYVDFAGDELVLGQSMAMGSERPAHEAEMFRAMFENRREFWLPDHRFRQAQAQATHSAYRLWRARLFDRRGGNPRLLRLGAALAAGLALSAALAALLPAGAGWTMLCILAFVPGIILGLAGQRAVGELRRCPWPRWQALPGLIALVLLALVGARRVLYAAPALALQLFAGWQLAFGGRRTAAGTEALGYLLGLRRFLLSASPRRLQEICRRDPAWLQSALPYALELGLAGRLAAQMEQVRIEEPAWLRTDESLREPRQLIRQETALLTQLRGQRKRSLRRLLRELL